MARNIVPRSDLDSSLGTAAKNWLNIYAKYAFHTLITALGISYTPPTVVLTLVRTDYIYTIGVDNEVVIISMPNAGDVLVTLPSVYAFSNRKLTIIRHDGITYLNCLSIACSNGAIGYDGASVDLWARNSSITFFCNNGRWHIIEE